MKLFWVSILLVVVGCEEVNKPISGDTRGVLIATHMHDGHKWVSARGSSGGIHLTHHPDCECMPKK